MRKYTTLIAGGAGFVGSHLCRRLLADGKRVVCIDNLSTGQTTNIEALQANPCLTSFYMMWSSLCMSIML